MFKCTQFSEIFLESVAAIEMHGYLMVLSRLTKQSWTSVFSSTHQARTHQFAAAAALFSICAHCRIFFWICSSSNFCLNVGVPTTVFPEGRIPLVIQ